LTLHFIQNTNNLPIIDHINRNRKDNRLENLRWATQYDNMRNKTKTKNNKLGLKHISPFRKGYQVHIIRDERFRYVSKDLNECILVRNSYLDFLGENYTNIDK